MDSTTEATLHDDPAQQPPEWGDRIAELLQELMQTQRELLSLLAKKRELVVNRDSAALNLLHLDEEKLVARLQACCQQRQQLLDEADGVGMPARTLESLAGSLPGESRQRLRPGLRDARRQSRLLQHQSLANWVLVQRSLLHLSQMMEIIATGGRMRPTYGKESPTARGGALVDQAV
ncbi:FlgN protein [Posidoniimonas corsicana]|uniref:FlgN protein n=1 Tax=Posidoniimonas corsicana TaxID=1938618 RepID=A0A5C5VH35_9BACT|nr:flagellar export chaperone FlgN [Posidoniimonas corsicana]TWT37924.1 FlgN protein [Posidoniimonas corsicana]